MLALTKSLAAQVLSAVQDDDGTAYLAYSSENNLVRPAIAQLLPCLMPCASMCLLTPAGQRR